MDNSALGDLVVLDLTEGVAGPYCTKWFSDFGAQVIKVETHEGDAARREGPFLDDVQHPETSALFLYLNTGKQSITVDLTQEAGQAVVARLARTADLVVDDSPPGTMAARGLAFEDLSPENAGLVYVAISAFGQTGPHRDYPATELTAAAFSGTMSARALRGRRPIKMGGAQSLYITGRSAFIAAMGALLLRDATGVGQFVDVSVQEAARHQRSCFAHHLLLPGPDPRAAAPAVVRGNRRSGCLRLQGWHGGRPARGWRIEEAGGAVG